LFIAGVYPADTEIQHSDRSALPMQD